MKAINRSVFVVRFREPYVSWASSIDDVAPEHARRLRDYVSVYLAPEDPTGRNEAPPFEDFFTGLNNWARPLRKRRVVEVPVGDPEISNAKNGFFPMGLSADNLLCASVLGVKG